MNIQWCGNSYFVIRHNDIEIAIDPHDGYSLNLKPCKINADYIIVTHNHFDHNAVEMAYGDKTKEVIRNYLGKKKVNGISFNFFEAFHDNANGKLYGKVIIFRLDIENINLGYLSDIGEKYNNSIKEKLYPTDVLMIPIGGVTTINYDEAIEYIDNLKPKIVIPMHYWIKGSAIPYDSINNFLNNVKYKVVEINENNIEIRNEDLPKETEIFVLNYNY
ncbi:hypothetical protein Calag_0741 [Caldisphaera lagunensis DSM 15908]|uniref:Zn-dependent hydrolase of beta-lactamase fold protein n=1 Tax=Caldisphaera lagunensis (strain DSM 15908 / JCM 11604 / ANMR 0165 / IC-154) TaxID=1056495 RepID=L0ABR2_CALLD|nr:MBL fold metallo-hydrolase [Caldisphaera lagunensis]AFZ70485.1 hypothetical protein Calag_0741 [Caldisphaera lagunensis DSM 15908]